MANSSGCLDHAPARGFLDAELRALDAHALSGVVCDGVKPAFGPGRGAVIKGAAVAAVPAQAVDQACLEIADEELAGPGIVADGAEARAGIGLAVVFDVGEQRDGAGGAVDLPHRARRAPFVETKLTRHPACAGLTLDQAVPSALTICKPNNEVAAT